MAKKIADKYGIDVNATSTSYNFNRASKKSDPVTYTATYNEKWTEVQDWLLRSFSRRNKESFVVGFRTSTKAKHAWKFEARVTSQQDAALRTFYKLLVSNYKNGERQWKAIYGGSMGYKAFWFSCLERGYTGRSFVYSEDYSFARDTYNIGRSLDEKFEEVK